MRVLAALAVAFAVPAVHAGQASAVFQDPDARFRVAVTVTDPAGDVGIRHFEAMRFSVRSTDSAEGRPLALARESRDALAPRSAAAVRGVPEDAERLLVNWSDVRAEIRIESVGQCVAGIYGTVEGTLERGKSGFVVVENTMSHVSVLTSRRGDADLYVYDGAGALVCASEMTRADRLPDQCAYLASDCGTFYIPESVVEVRGLRKRNDFHLTIWAVDAI